MPTEGRNVCLFARDAQALDQNGGGADRRRFKVQVAADARDILEQLVEIAGDREFLHGADNLAALDFQAAASTFPSTTNRLSLVKLAVASLFKSFFTVRMSAL